MSTVIDDWGEHAFFSGMPTGSLGADYVFNGGRSKFYLENGGDLMVVDKSNKRGLDLLVNNALILEVFCPSLLLTLGLRNVDNGTLRIEKGRPQENGSILWDGAYLFEEHFAEERRKLYTNTSLGTWSRFRFTVETHISLLQETVSIDCSECANLPPC